MFAINDIVVLIDLDYDSYVRSEGFKEAGVIVKVLNTQGNAIKVESTGTGFWLRIGAFRMASPAEKEAYNTGLRSIRDIKSADLTGRYIKALISAPYGGMVDKGEYGKITDHSGLNGCYVDFPSHRRYYWTDLKEASKGEVMPVGFDPKTSNSVDPTEDLSYYTNRYFKVLKGVFNSISCVKGDYLYQYDRDRCKIMRNSSPYYLSKPWAYIKSGDIELMPLGFDPTSDQVSAKPASLYPDYARCIEACSTAYTFNKIYPVNKDGDIEDNNGTYSTTSWKRKGNGNSDFEASSKEAFISHGTKTLINPFKKGDVVMVDHSKIGTSFYSDARSICSGLIADKCYVIDQLTDNGTYTAGTFLRLEGEACYVHPYDIFYLAPKETVLKVTTGEAKRRYPIGTSFISPENGRTYRVRLDSYRDEGFYEGSGNDILCHHDSGGGGAYVYYDGKWAEIKAEPINSSNVLTSLPSNWCIKRTSETYLIVNKWFTDNGYGSPYLCDNCYICTSSTYEVHSLVPYGYKEITLQQFKDWVMTKPTKKEDKADATKQSVRPSDDLEFQKPILVKRVKSKSKLVIIN